MASTKSSTIFNPSLPLMGVLIISAWMLNGYGLVEADQATEASFYGESYVLDSAQVASKDVLINLNFMSGQPDGMLLLATGKLDYILIQLNAGIIETRANLGSGEAVVFSARGVHLNDLRWHTVNVACRQGVLYLDVDKKSQGQATMPGDFHELNIDLGIYLGGNGGSFRENLHKGREVKSFRGCLRNAFFNDRDILENAKALTYAHNAFGVSWHCDDIFLARSDIPISLESNRSSFMAFPYIRTYTASRNDLSCHFKTRSSNAILFFNSGTGATYKDFIAVELVDGRPKLSVDKGSGIVDVALEVSANDGKWHTLQVIVSEASAKIQLDWHANLTRFHLGGQNHLNLGAYFYVGGLGQEAHFQASKLELASFQGNPGSAISLLGCIRNITINSQDYSFRQIQSSQHINAGCPYTFPCSENPCVDTSKCVEVHKSDFICECDQEACITDPYKNSVRNLGDSLSSIISIRDVIVPNGGSAAINQNAIQVRDRYKTIFMQENIIFRVLTQPQNGTLRVRNKAGVPSSFTWREAMSNSVYYWHYKGHTQVDSITLEISRQATGSKEQYRFLLPVRIVTNKKFEVTAPSGYIFEISSEGRMQITPDVLSVESDTEPSLISFQVSFLRHAKSYFLLSSDPKQHINSFTVQDLQEGAVWFQHNKDSVVYTRLNVTDLIQHESQTIDLRFRKVALELQMETNTGIFMSYGSSHLITAKNLTFTAGSGFEYLKISYQITQTPNHGLVQKFSADDKKWIDVEEFTQLDIDAHKIRYHHIPDESYSNQDSFRFQARSNGIVSTTKNFEIIFRPVVLKIESNNRMMIHDHTYGSFSNETLLVTTKSETEDFGKIIFSVIKEPSKGNIYLVRRPVTSHYDFDRISSLRKGDTFTQTNVNEGLVYYRYNTASRNKDVDYTDLQASYYGYHVMVRAIIQYSPGNIGLHLINRGLIGVVEGGSKVITKRVLFIETDKFKNFTFSLVEGPHYGSLNLIDPKTSSILKHNVSSFLVSQLVAGTIAYQHDDSENSEDFFTFKASPNVREDMAVKLADVEEFTDTFHVSIAMRNDNPPKRVFTKTLHVVIGKTKTITIWDLKFSDNDVDFDDLQLLYQFQEIPIGDILDKVTEEEVFNFTQKELAEEKLIFHHKDGRYARVPVLVSDGQFVSSSILEIQASEPFLHVIGSLQLQIESGQKATLETDDIDIESNLDFLPEEVFFHISTLPVYGILKVNGNTNADFSYLDLLLGNVKYYHHGQSVASDSIDFSLTVKSYTQETQLRIKVTTSDLSGPPEIIHNKMLRVNARQIQVITNEHLEAAHRSYLPQKIKFLVTEIPRHGHLVIRGKPATNGPKFSQEDVNNRLVVYASDSPVHLSDSFVFEVSTEKESLRNLEFLIEVIPEEEESTQANITVSEGGQITLNRDLFSLSSQLARVGVVFFKVDTLPMHGKIVLQDIDGRKKVLSPTRAFSWEDLAHGRVAYQHDGSESLLDMLTIKALPDQDKPSNHPGEKVTVMVTISPVDDQPPRIVINSGLDLWSGSLERLTGNNLRAVDPDTASHHISYLVLDPPNNGHLAFLNNTFKVVRRFSQLDLDSEDLVFVHRGVEYGQFTVQVTDGTNIGDTATVRVRARPVTISMTTIVSLFAFPNAIQPITNQTFLAEVSASNYSHPLIFTLVSPHPRRGRLVTQLGRQLIEIRSFTQDEVNQGKVFYEHTAFQREWQTSDQLHFEVSTAYAKTLKNNVLEVDISFGNINVDNYRNLLKINTKDVKEGGKVYISTDCFNSKNFVRAIKSFRQDASVHFSFESFAYHGWLWYKDQEFKQGDEFTQADLDSQLLVYKHDHSNTLSDFFVFGVRIVVPKSSTAHDIQLKDSKLYFNFTFAIEPVNDGRFELITRHPKISVTQGSEIAVTKDNLTTVDLDTGPEGLEYIIETQPKNGKLVLRSEPTERLRSFTQQQINNLEIIFKHDGSAKASSSIYFKVWDKRFPPFYGNMDIVVKPLVINVGKGSHIPIVQGTSSITLSPSQLKVTTNGDKTRLRYDVLQKPQFGRLNPATQFTHTDLEQGKVRYFQDIDSPGDDFFVANLQLTYVDVTRERVMFEIIQCPLIKSSGPLIVTDTWEGKLSVASHVAITRAALDASELARLTDDNPRFKVTEHPQYGRLVVRQKNLDRSKNKSELRQRRQTSDIDKDNSFQLASEFTFEDILFRRIYYMPGDRPTSALQDKFIYELSAKGVPPAKGELLISLKASNKETNVSEPTSGIENDGAIIPFDADVSDDKDNGGNGGRPDDDSSIDPKVEDVEGESSQDKDNNITIIIIVVIVCLLVLMVVVGVIIWRRRQQTKKRMSEHQKLAAKPRPLISGPLQLEQSHRLTQDVSENDFGDLSNNDSDSRAMLTLNSPARDSSQECETIALVSACGAFSPTSNSKLVPSRTNESTYVNTAQVRNSHGESSCSPDVTMVSAVSKGGPESESSVSEDAGELRSTITSGRGSSASGDLVDWSLMDPDLLQSCNVTTPALRSNQYWL